jgi:hypothetical protein
MSKLKVFSLELGEDDTNYDCTCEVAIFAKDEEQARKLVHENNLGGLQDNAAWLDPTRSSCKEVVPKNGKIIIASYNAG